MSCRSRCGGAPRGRDRRARMTTGLLRRARRLHGDGRGIDADSTSANPEKAAQQRIETFGRGHGRRRLGSAANTLSATSSAPRRGAASRTFSKRLNAPKARTPTAPLAQSPPWFVRHVRRSVSLRHHDHERGRGMRPPRARGQPWRSTARGHERERRRPPEPGRTAREHRPDPESSTESAAIPFMSGRPWATSQASNRSLVGRDAARELRQDLAARAHHDRSHGRVEGELVATDRRGALRRIRGATDEAKERELVDGSKRVRPASHRIGERSGGHTRTEGVAQRLTVPRSVASDTEARAPPAEAGRTAHGCPRRPWAPTLAHSWSRPRVTPTRPGSARIASSVPATYGSGVSPRRGAA